MACWLFLIWVYIGYFLIKSYLQIVSLVKWNIAIFYIFPRLMQWMMITLSNIFVLSANPHHQYYISENKCKCVNSGDKCRSSDFTYWSIRDELKSTECVMGKDTRYERKRPSSHCYIGPEYNRTLSEKPCPCQASDFEW